MLQKSVLLMTFHFVYSNVSHPRRHFAPSSASRIVIPAAMSRCMGSVMTLGQATQVPIPCVLKAADALEHTGLLICKGLCFFSVAIYMYMFVGPRAAAPPGLRSDALSDYYHVCLLHFLLSRRLLCTSNRN